MSKLLHKFVARSYIRFVHNASWFYEEARKRWLSSKCCLCLSILNDLRCRNITADAALGFCFSSGNRDG